MAVQAQEFTAVSILFSSTDNTCSQCSSLLRENWRFVKIAQRLVINQGIVIVVLVFTRGRSTPRTLAASSKMQRRTRRQKQRPIYNSNVGRTDIDLSIVCWPRLNNEGCQNSRYTGADCNISGLPGQTGIYKQAYPSGWCVAFDTRVGGRRRG